MQRILITGIPGMGKTTLGNLLAERGFRHIEMETEEKEHAFLHSNPRSFVDSIGEEKDVVISWGFNPLGCTVDILFLKNEGFKLIWLDGDRNIAFREFANRESKRDLQNLQHHISNFHMQIKNIEEKNTVQEIDPIIVNTFDEDGEFIDSGKTIEKIVQS